MTINNTQLSILSKIAAVVIQKCPFVSKQKKIDSRAKTVFPGQQNYQNCGVEASRQMIELTTCKQMSEDEALNDAIQHQDAEEINDSNGNLLLNESGGTDPQSRGNFISRNGGDTLNLPYSRDEVAKALKNNQPIIFSANCEDLAPGTDENGNEIETWVAKKEYQTPTGQTIQPGDPLGVGGHAVLVTGGEFDKNGNLIKVHINDTGIGKRYTMNVVDFENARRPNRDLNISTKSIKEKCP